VKSTSIALAVASPFDPTHCPAFDVQRYWIHALSVAEIACQLAKHTPNTVEIQTARAAGLLHNLGLLWISDQLPELTQQAIQVHQYDGTLSLDQALTDLIGAGYRQASGYLGEAWNLPSPLVIIMKHHGEPGYREEEWRMAQLVGLAVSMVSTAQARIPWSAPLSLTEELEIEPAHVDLVFSAVGSRLDRTRELAGVLFGH